MVKFNCDSCGLCCRYVGLQPSTKELDRGDGVCMFLNENNKCDIYEHRPLICNVQKLYERYYADKMTIEEFFELNEKACNKIKEENKYGSSESV